ncbi:LOW QUALITY PROTEIN: TLR4 interactor with leucine rich repeats [Hemicordylus capensis]|uniref:LOW QUALITY PROTEIN: TLR4 interactor with leucine rich repeats n=1 Tax=Hemicordylus capensis TaxID=884348 RepID=UPI0023025CF6|nr:LOW QUALITY PROTEIN: TLR4 interactor with leucine rich repeats [Hemicordylus capensis]
MGCPFSFPPSSPLLPSDLPVSPRGQSVGSASFRSVCLSPAASPALLCKPREQQPRQRQQEGRREREQTADPAYPWRGLQQQRQAMESPGCAASEELSALTRSFQTEKLLLLAPELSPFAVQQPSSQTRAARPNRQRRSPVYSRCAGEGDAGETPRERRKQTAARPSGMEPLPPPLSRRVRPLELLLVCCSLVLLPPAVEPICPEPCDCQQQQHLLCTNRGLRAVPKAVEPQDILTYSLGGNFIANISAFDFHRLVALQRLDLQYNRIRTLHPKAFERLARLEELYLGNNLLTALAPGTLRPLVKLRILYVNANEINYLNSVSFAGLSSLVKLRLDGNALGSLGDATFSGLTNLLYLHLEANRIRWLSRNAFAGLGKLRFLDLSGNQQNSLRHADTFRPMHLLNTLFLSGNNLQQLGNGLFQHLSSLAKLSLSGNRLAWLAPEAFTGLGALKEMRLEGNLLTQLPATLLQPLQSLEVLDLSHNLLAALHPAAFGHLHKLRELSLQENGLTTMSGDLFASSPALYRLDLDGNAWNCDCRLRGLKHWLGSWHSQGRLLTVFVQCRQPPALAGKYLDYLEDAQLLPPLNGSSCSGGAASPSPPPPRGNSSYSPGLAQGKLSSPPSASTIQLVGSQKTLAPERESWAGDTSATTSASRLLFSTRPPSLPGAAWPRRAGKHHLVSSVSGIPPLVTDPCDFNTLFLYNLSVDAVSASAVTVRWGVRPHRSPRLLGPVRFRILFDRFGAAVKFQRYVYLPDWSEPTATLQELRPDTPYLVCVEGVIGGRVCPVAPRDHCAGLVTLPEEGAGTGAAAAVAGGAQSLDHQLLTLVLLAVNALLLFLALAAWASRLVRKKVLGCRRRKTASPVHIRQMYSTRRPLRSMGTGVSADFSGFQSHRPPRSTVCALSEADLIEFPCERFMDSGGGGSSSAQRGDDHLLQRFAD